VRLVLDHHFSPMIAAVLRERGHDVIACTERGWHTASDEELLALGSGEERAVLTNNVADFMSVSRSWSGVGRSHFGLAFTSDARMPRSRASIGTFVESIDRLMTAHSGARELRDQVVWLSPAP